MRTHRIFASEAEIAALTAAFLDRTLPKPAWTHAAHFAAAVWLLARRPDIDAMADMPGLIRAYNEATGVANTDTGGYHATITLASLRAARAWLRAHAAVPPHAACNALLRSELGDPDWLLRYWSRAALFSTAARRFWIEPDLARFPYP
jgi:hypothetical protein